MNNFWYGKRVLVTGGSGFIGSFVVEMLLDRGADVIVTASKPDTAFRFLENARDQVTIAEGKLEDPKVAQKSADGAEVLMHLAARVGGIEYNIRHPGSIFRTNMQINTNVLEAARTAKVRRIMLTSSACVYPRHCSIPTPESEGFAERPEPTNEGYGWSKRMLEFMGEAYAREYGMDICIARPYNAYGPRDNFDPSSSHVIPALIRRVIKDGQNPLIVWGDGTASRSFLYVEDFARGLIEVAEKSPQIQAVNLGAEQEITIADLAEMIIKLSGKKIDMQLDPSKPGGQPRRCCDTTFAKKLIGFETKVSLETGLKKTIKWYKENMI